MPFYSMGTLATALAGIQSSLKQLKAFWDSHAAFLGLLLTRQTNYPSPGGDAKTVLDLWTSYQKVLLRSSSSLLESIQELSTDPTPRLSPKPNFKRYRTIHEPSKISSDYRKGYSSEASDDSEHSLTPKLGRRSRIVAFCQKFLLHI